MSTQDLDAALAAARAGDETGISTLFRALHPQLLQYARSRAGDAAEEVVGDAWLAAARRFERFEGDAGDFRAWMFTIVRSRIVDHYRSGSRRPELVGLEAVDHPQTEDSGDLVVERLSSEQAVALITGRLPADQAEVVILRVVADLSVEQVALVTGHSESSVRVMQHRALKRLAKVLHQEPVTN